MDAAHFAFRVHHERLAIARLAPDAPVPPWALGDFVTISRTATELSVLCAEVHVPADVLQVRNRVALGIVGVVPMTTIGLLAGLCTALATAGVPVFVISTYDTDYLLVTAERLDDTRRALEGLGHRVQD